MTLQRQYITDHEGNTVGVILPIEELKELEQFQQERRQEESQRIQQMKEAASDPLFMADLQETMEDFAKTDSEWWEQDA